MPYLKNGNGQRIGDLNAMNSWTTKAESEVLTFSENCHSHMTVLLTLETYRTSRTVDVGDI